MITAEQAGKITKEANSFKKVDMEEDIVKRLSAACRAGNTFIDVYTEDCHLLSIEKWLSSYGYNVKYSSGGYYRVSWA